MSQQAVDILLRGYRAFVAGDLDAIEGMLDSSLVHGIRSRKLYVCVTWLSISSRSASSSEPFRIVR